MTDEALREPDKLLSGMPEENVRKTVLITEIYEGPEKDKT
jgi:hypothetical protein